MTISVVLVLADGSAGKVGDYDDFAEAVRDALTLANRHGDQLRADVKVAERVEVRDGQSVELAISVIRGGLAFQRSGDRSAATS